MRRAVLVFAHKDVKLLNAFIQQLLAEDETDIYIHLDKKSEAIKRDILSNSHVFFIQNNVSVFWGDDSMMKCLFASWEEICAQGGAYDYFIMCTGQDLVIKKGLTNYLLQNPQKIYLDAKRSDYYDARYRAFLTHKYPRYLCRDMNGLPKYHPLKILRALHYRLVKYGIYPSKQLNIDISQMRFYYSFNWSVMPYSVFNECVRILQDNSDYKKLYADTYLPEDGFLATIIMNSKYAKDVVWSNDTESYSLTYHSPFIVHPRIYTREDISEIENSPCYFARKFDSKVDSGVIEYFKNKIVE